MTSPLKEYRELSTPTQNLKEPAVVAGGTVTTVAGLLSLVYFLVPGLQSNHTTDIVLVVGAFLLPILTAIFTRKFVWSPATVGEIIDEAIKEAEDTMKGRKDV